MTPYQKNVLDKIPIGAMVSPWRNEIRLPTCLAIEKLGYLKIIKEKYSDIGLTGNTTFKRVK